MALSLIKLLSGPQMIINLIYEGNNHLILHTTKTNPNNLGNDHCVKIKEKKKH